MNFVKRLQKGCRSWQKMIEPALSHRDKMLEYWAAGYFNKAVSGMQILKLIDRGVGIIVPYMTMANPAVSVSCKRIALKPFAKTLELTLQEWLDKVNFSEDCLRPLIINSLFGLGVIKVGVMAEEEAEWRGNYFQIGQPYFEVIDDSDYIGDVAAKSRADFEFEGHRYLLPTEFAKDFFGGKAADKIKPDYKLHGDHSPDNLTKNTLTGEDFHTLKDYSEFIDLYIQDQNEVITIMADETSDKILRTVDKKDDGNPFDVLGYKFMPKCPLPIPPVWSWLDMDTAINVLASKMKQQAERQKSVLIYQSEASEDADRIKSSTDGGAVKVDNIGLVQELKFGGVNPENYQWVNYIESQFSIQGGNLYTMGGRNTQAETLGQEQMLMSNASKMLDDMVNQVYRFVKRNIKKVGMFIWTDPLYQQRVIKSIGSVIEVEEIFDRMSKEGSFSDYDIDVKPYSMQRFNPMIKQQMLMQFLTGWIIPVLPLAQQQGNELDVNKVTKELADTMGIDLGEFWKSAVPQQTDLNSLVPQQSGSPGQSDDRLGASGSSKMANSNQFQNSTRANKPSPDNKKKKVKK